MSRSGSVNSTRAHRLLSCGLYEQEVCDLFYRDITPEDYDLLLRLDEPLPKRRAGGEEALERLLTKARYERRHAVCGVCLMPTEDADDVAAVRCPAEHEFHRACISKWLSECKNSCPVCNADLAEP